MKKIIFKGLRNNANRLWKKVVAAKSPQDAVKLTIKALERGADPNYIMMIDGCERALLDLLPTEYPEARLLIKRAGGRCIEEIYLIKEEGKMLAQRREQEYQKEQDLLKDAVVALSAKEEDVKNAAILREVLSAFK